MSVTKVVLCGRFVGEKSVVFVHTTMTPVLLYHGVVEKFK